MAMELAETRSMQTPRPRQYTARNYLKGVAYAQIRCVVTRAAFRIIRDGIAGAILVRDGAIHSVQIGPLRQRVQVADSPRVRVLVEAGLVILAHVRPKQPALAERGCEADENLIAVG